MINTLKHLLKNHKMKLICFILAFTLLIFTLVYRQYASIFSFYLVFILIMYPYQDYLQKKRKKEIDYMWSLAETLNISATTLSHVTDIGIIDLAATKQEGNGVYCPPRKNILNGITYLENLSQH